MLLVVVVVVVELAPFGGGGEGMFWGCVPWCESGGLEEEDEEERPGSFIP